MKNTFGSIRLVILSSLLMASGSGQSALAAGADSSDSGVALDSTKIHLQTENLHRLQADLKSGKPTLAFFYYSVACSCTAARCQIAAAVIDSIPELHGKNDSINYEALDAYLVPEAESLYNLMIMPAVVYFDKDGKEVNRLEWGTSREAINMLIVHPDIKQVPID
jgi:hypothetical protein